MLKHFNSILKFINSSVNEEQLNSCITMIESFKNRFGHNSLVERLWEELIEKEEKQKPAEEVLALNI